MFDYNAAGASTSNLEVFWREDGLTSNNAAVKRRGNLYIVAEGPPSECSTAVKAIRDEYYGDTAQPKGGNSAALLQSMEAANSLLSKRSGIGASCISATVTEWGQLSLLRAGDCHAYLYSGIDGGIHKLGERQAANKALGRSAEAQLSETRNVLSDKDVLILCSGAFADGLTQDEIASTVSKYSSFGPEEIANQLVDKASQHGTGGISTALVVMCEGSGSGIDPTLPLTLDIGDRRGAVAGEGASIDGRTKKRSQRTLRLRLGFPKIGNIGQVPMLAGGAAVLVTALLMSRPLLSDPSASDLAERLLVATQTSIGDGQEPERVSPTVQPAQPTAESFETLSVAVDAAWRKTEWGDAARRQEMVSSLEQLRGRSPEDKRIADKLNIARTNLTYAQHMQEVADYWGKGDTSAATTGAWARAVETLEALKVYSLPHPLSSEQQATARDKLYSAHINYGKALDQAKRSGEARAQRERAEEVKSRLW